MQAGIRALDSHTEFGRGSIKERLVSGDRHCHGAQFLAAVVLE